MITLNNNRELNTYGEEALLTQMMKVAYRVQQQLLNYREISNAFKYI